MVSLDLAGPDVRPLNPIFLGADRRGWRKGRISVLLIKFLSSDYHIL